MQNINPFHVELYNKLNDTQKYWLKKYPYYFKGGKDWAGAAIVLDTLSECDYTADNQPQTPGTYLPRASHNIL